MMFAYLRSASAIFQSQPRRTFGTKIDDCIMCGAVIRQGRNCASRAPQAACDLFDPTNKVVSDGATYRFTSKDKAGHVARGTEEYDVEAPRCCCS